jgi:outer membrane protein OmpA-like peptidoglycan-associated protein
MMNLKKASVLAAISVMLAPAAFAADGYKDVVKATGGEVVRSTNGNCVITKWNATYEECGMSKRDISAKLLTKEQRNVYFDFNKSTLSTTEKKELDEVSKIITASKEVGSVDIVGYADQVGSSSYNQKLSAKRAANVKAYLAKKGLKTNNVRVEGLGEGKSVTKCDAIAKGAKASKELIACLAEDRRVEIKVNGIAN